MTEQLKPGAVLFAKDLPRVARFYETLLSMAVVLTQQDLIVLESDAFQLVIHPIPEAVARAITITSPPHRRTDVPTKLVFPVSSIARARLEAPALGGAVDASDKEWQARNFRACDGHDPEGNVLQLREVLVS